jgi:uncharacterized RDD family membrane protein YckC
MNDDELNPYAAPLAELHVEDFQDDSLREDASNTKRFLNYLIDRVAIVGIFAALFFVGGLLENAGVISGVIDFADEIGAVADFVLTALGTVFYYTLMESTFGRSLGKLVTGTKVINLEGKRPKVLTLLGRSFARLVPFEPFSFFGNGGGWHDRWTDTRVVDMRKPPIPKVRPMPRMPGVIPVGYRRPLPPKS